MEMLRLQNYLPVILIAVFNFECSYAIKHNSALITQVIKVPNGVSSAKLIKCAFQLMKKSDKYFVRIAGETDGCELVDRRSPSLMGPSFFTEGFEYLQKSSLYDIYVPPSQLRERARHYIYSKVEIGDTFNFVFQKLKNGKMFITFRNSKSSAHALMIDDYTTGVTIRDKYNGSYGDEIIPSYPFQDFKIYKILVEVLETYWKISVNGKVLTTYDHRVPLDIIAMINIRCGPSVKYLSKDFNPRNQPQDLTKW